MNDGAVALAVLAAILLTGGSKKAPSAPPRARGPVTPGGSIEGSVVASQVSASAPLQKRYTDMVSVTTRWYPQTVDAGEHVIPWYYRLRTEIGHNTVTGWKRPDELGFGTDRDGRVIETHVQNMALSEEQAAARVDMIHVFPVPQDRNQTWDVRVFLEALRSDDNGVIILESWTEVARGEVVGAFQSIDNRVTPGGSLDVTVEQRRSVLALLAGR